MYFFFLRRFHRLTADALTCLLLRKIREGTDNRNLAAEFSLDCGRISRILTGLRNHIYRTDPWLQRGRQLHIDR